MGCRSVGYIYRVDLGGLLMESVEIAVGDERRGEIAKITRDTFVSRTVGPSSLDNQFHYLLVDNQN
jgi:hypothetical protein